MWKTSLITSINRAVRDYIDRGNMKPPKKYTAIKESNDEEDNKREIDTSRRDLLKV